MATERLSAFPLAVFGGVLAWWGWKSGGYFEVTFLPGTMVLLFLIAVLLFSAPWPGALRGAALVSIVALTILAGWTVISAIWSPVPAIAFSDAQRAVAYAAAFVIGVWSCLLLGRRMLLALTAVVAAGALVGIATFIALWTGHDSREYFELDATLRFPIGYRNAEAAFFLMATLAAVALNASGELDWRVRGVVLGSSTLMVELALLAQSRASLFAALIGVAVLIVAHRDRLRVVGWLTLTIAPAIIALPWLFDVFQRDAGNTVAEIPPLHHACVAMAITSGLSVAIGCAAARLGRSVTLPDRARRAIGGGLLAGLALVVLMGVIALARTEGGPVGFASRHIDQLSAGTPNLSQSGSRFGVDVRSERGDFWRISLDDFARHPLRGDGAGGFRPSYLQQRRSDVQPEDPHSVEMVMLAELGLPGILLFLTFVIGAVVAVLRARRLGSSAAALAAGALALGAYWLVHASVDWFWPYAGITLPVPFALGAAAAPALRRDVGKQSSRRYLRPAAAVAAGMVAVTMIPFFLSARYTNQAIRTWRSDVQASYDDLQRAADLNPWSSRPLAAEATLANDVGDRNRALRAIDDGLDRTPQEWILYYERARALADTDPAGARAALQRAEELDRGGPEIDRLAMELSLKH